MKIEFFYDCSSPWTYLAFHGVQPIAAEAGAEILWRPFLVGGVFNTVNKTVYEARANPVEAKLNYTFKDMNDWTRLYGLKIGAPSVFPVNSVKAMRGAFVAEEHGKIVEYSRKVFETYWTDLRDISDDAVLTDIVGAVGLERGEYFEKITSAPYKEKLRSNTEELIERGGFGTPTLFVDGDDMYFGNDRLQLLRHALKQS